MNVSRLVTCGTHGSVPPAFVCRHLRAALENGDQVGVHWLRDGNGHANAWCDECQSNLDRQGGEWNDETEGFAGITMICQTCFNRLRDTNRTRDLN